MVVRLHRVRLQRMVRLQLLLLLQSVRLHRLRLRKVRLQKVRLSGVDGVLGGQAYGLKQLVAALVVCDGWRVVAACLAPPSLL